MLVLDLFDKKLETDQLVLTVGYDIENLTDPKRSSKYKGPVTVDYYGRRVPKHAHGTVNLKNKTASSKIIIDAVMDLYDKIVNFELLVRRVNISANRIVPAGSAVEKDNSEQLSMFVNYEEEEEKRKAEALELEEEKHLQQAMLDIKKKYGKNALLKGMNLQEGATARQRNNQIGGHKA